MKKLILILGLISLGFFYSCSNSKQAQRKWNSGISKDRETFVVNSEELARIEYKRFAEFCAEYYKPILKNDSTRYLEAKSKYDELVSQYSKDMKNAANKINELDAIIQAGQDSGNDTLIISGLRQKVFLLTDQLSKCNNLKPVILDPIIQQVSDSATAAAYLQAKVALQKMEYAKDLYKEQLNEERASSKGKIKVPIWAVIVLGAGIVVYGVFKIRSIFTPKI